MDAEFLNIAATKGAGQARERPLATESGHQTRLLVLPHAKQIHRRKDSDHVERQRGEGSYRAKQTRYDEHQ
jgi:hypothetical protein